MRHLKPAKEPPRRFSPDRRHWVKVRGGRAWRAKVAYESDDAAWEFLQTHPRLLLQGYRAYCCPVCCKYHVGHAVKIKRI